MLTLLRTIIHLSCFMPLMWLLFVLFSENDTALGADPVKEIEHFLGYTAILIFCAMFVLGILLQLLNKNQYQILRRPLGLWAFAWALLHVASYLFLELGLDFSLFVSELLTRPYLILGGIAFLILLVMAVTSLPQIKTWLGKRWFQIHQFAYVAIACAAIHYYWSSKSLTLSPILVGAVVIVIIIWKYLGKHVPHFSPKK
ncbi:sulfoxide reductase heme-binding subunit YedZ [Canicola haemoglobinophilus]|uniref:Protein-methionine-sulfoxide reductase heme-binding subunit MsrQ n=1 Tax=Canicola haemoglobinophilus TaxID=733 RepID=A0A1V4B192_9PAST|nr:protein-methionine-sulfoxide reductase heme-binding subunit MsrQ [Canicola haemoglobinophilus]OOS00680.1 sulfoxide reductase heme-binding subunit YedZ [Canicola haemoglobinophilus]STO54327.1 sulfite oxidase subunit YedZ [Canicola haemoglobinophilus]STO60203.1 sulfite oxidase subunit YedZ [Canicola haemoglobinophilus]STO68861.1 sulfite oxidase subunit YedZ [Canicola haemoglobinophilus]